MIGPEERPSRAPIANSVHGNLGGLGIRRLSLTSSVSGRRYTLHIAPPRDGVRSCRILYVLDGDCYFGTALEAVRSYENASDVAVIGIGYPKSPSFVRSSLDRKKHKPEWLKSRPAHYVTWLYERQIDLTLPASDALLAEQDRLGLFALSSKDVGGLDDFLSTLERDVKPLVSRHLSVDPHGQAIFGHSLGGLAVLHALFTRPTAFATFLTSSPSIWWARRGVLQNEPLFHQLVHSGDARPRILITVGEREESSASVPYAFEADDASVLDVVRDRRMVTNAHDLSGRLNTLVGKSPYCAELAVFAGVGHDLAPWPAMARAIAFAFGPGTAEKRGLW